MSISGCLCVWCVCVLPGALSLSRGDHFTRQLSDLSHQRGWEALPCSSEMKTQLKALADRVIFLIFSLSLSLLCILPPFPFSAHEAVKWISTAPAQMILHLVIWFVCLWRQHWVCSGRALKSCTLSLDLISVIWLLKSPVKEVNDVVLIQLLQMLGMIFPTSYRRFVPPPASSCFISPYLPWPLLGIMFILEVDRLFGSPGFFFYDLQLFLFCNINISHSDQVSDKVKDG